MPCSARIRPDLTGEFEYWYDESFLMAFTLASCDSDTHLLATRDVNGGYQRGYCWCFDRGMPADNWVEGLAKLAPQVKAQFVLAFIKGLCLSTLVLHLVTRLIHMDLTLANLAVRKKLPGPSLAFTKKGTFHIAKGLQDGDTSEDLTPSNIEVVMIDRGISSSDTPKPYCQSGMYESDCVLKLLGWQWLFESIFTDLFSMGIILIQVISNGTTCAFFENMKCPEDREGQQGLQAIIGNAINRDHLGVNEGDDSWLRIINALYRYFVLTYSDDMAVITELFEYTKNDALITIRTELVTAAKTPGSQFREDIKKYSLISGTAMESVRKSPVFKNANDAVVVLLRMIAPVPYRRLVQEEVVRVLRTEEELDAHFAAQAKAAARLRAS